MEYIIHQKIETQDGYKFMLRVGADTNFLRVDADQFATFDVGDVIKISLVKEEF
jgi:hypothetical protein